MRTIVTASFVSIGLMSQYALATPDTDRNSNYARQCDLGNGINPSKASLAVAMATELGRWDPVHDLAVDGNNVTLSASAWLRCGNGCAKTSALLAELDPASVNVGTSTGSSQYRNELVDSYMRQRQLDGESAQEDLAPLHRLTLVGGPVRLGENYCGSHYVFQADRIDGQPLSRDEISRLQNALCFYGEGRCGGNPFLSFVQTDATCPTGRTCVAIDPTDGDNGSLPPCNQTSSPGYYMNRTYDPANELLSCGCLYSDGLDGVAWWSQLVSKCSTVPSTCGYLYCDRTQTGTETTTFMIWSDSGNNFAMNALYGADEGTYVGLSDACNGFSPGNPDCQWVYGSDHMIRSFRNQSLAVTAWDGASHGAYLRLTGSCQPWNTNCTWSYVNGRFVSDADSSLSINAWNGAGNGVLLRLHNECASTNPDCTWNLQ